MIDLFCGLGGWTDGLLAEGWDVVGFDVERHEYGDAQYPAQLVLQDVLTLHGSQFKNAALIVASPPCQEFSYMAMPWSRAKAKISVIESCPTEWLRLCVLFDACFRIQAEACAASGRHIPLIVENVRGAQRWVGRSRWNFGSFHLWGDVPALMPMTKQLAKAPGQDWNRFKESGEVSPDWKFQGVKNPGIAHHSDGSTNFHGTKVESEQGRRTDVGKGARFTSRDCGVEGAKNRGFRFDGSGRSMQSESVDRHIKNTGGSWSAVAHNTTSGKGRNPDGRKGNGSGAAWFDANHCVLSSKSNARKAASAHIAKIPLPLSRYIGRVFKPLHYA